MKLVKLDAINSTNTFLKLLAKEEGTSNWTIVTTEYQTKGRGQVTTNWESERGKNLIFSSLIKYSNFQVKHHFYLNCAISLGLINALKKFDIPQLMVKWPNDIMAGNKKLAGILIENSLSDNKIYQSVVGIGLNINQKKFSAALPKAVSMTQILNQKLDRNSILVDIINSVKEQINLLENNEFEQLQKNYESNLFKKNKTQMFEDKNKTKFLGIILGVSNQGMLRIETENRGIREYNFKEVAFL